MNATHPRLHEVAASRWTASAAAPTTIDGVDTDWPNRAHSALLHAGGLRWHVQRMGRGPALLLLHGTGASTHSWRDFAPALAAHFDVIAPDLPGHAFTEALPGRRQSLPGMALALAALLRELDARPAIIVGHSAGAAIGAQLCLAGLAAPAQLVSLNGALLPFRGLAGLLFAPAARLVAGKQTLARLIARRAREPEAVRRLLLGTGSRLDARGEALYARLFASPAHVAAVLNMMANWQLEPLGQALPGLAPRLTLVCGDGDRAVPPADASRVAGRVAGARVIRLPGLGHLAHEEAPAQLARLVVEAAAPMQGEP